jgi:acetyl/propionyl-CoA carboxylase alpha subunit
MKKLYKVSVNNKEQNKFEFDSQEKTVTLNDKSSDWDVAVIKKGIFNIIKDNKSYNAEVLEADYLAKTFLIRINGNKYSVVVKDRYDDLLHDLGMDTLSNKKVDNLKAPMPGLVLDIRVIEGQKISKNDPIIVLEAMKMENILKATSDGVIKKINIKKGEKVEKNQVLVSFE